MKSLYFTEEHELLRQSLRDFFKTELAPHFGEWEAQEQIPRWAWQKMGEMGYLGLDHPAAYGGLDADWFTNVVFCEEISRTLNAGFSAAITVHQYMATNHLKRAGTPAQKEQYLRPAIAGEKIACLGMSEPQVGSNVQGLKTFAADQGDYYLINGSKIFITNGYYADFMTLCCQTDQGLSLMLVDLDSPGITRNKLKKIGWHSSDTAEVFFEDVKVPKENLLGQAGKGFYLMADSLQTERLIASISSLGSMEGVLAITRQYMQEREAFGRPIAQFQALRHRMANLYTEMEACRQLVYHTTWLVANGVFAVKECSMCKLHSAELMHKIAHECLQMHGGYGFMEDFKIAQVFRDSRAGTLAGGTSEIMREIIAKMTLDDVSYQKAY